MRAQGVQIASPGAWIDQAAFLGAGQVHDRAALSCRQDHQPRRLRLKRAQGDVVAQRVCRSGAVKMRVPRCWIDHVAADHGNHARTQRAKGPIGGGKGHGPAAIDKAAKAVLDWHIVLRGGDLLAGQQRAGVAIGRKILGVDQPVPIRAHAPGIVDGHQNLARALCPTLRGKNPGTGPENNGNRHVSPQKRVRTGDIGRSRQRPPQGCNFLRLRSDCRAISCPALREPRPDQPRFWASCSRGSRNRI